MVINKQLERTIADFELFAKNFLVIKPKVGASRKFVLNRAQQHVNNLINQQKKATGKVRVLIDKGRQLGMSTLIEGRYFWLVITNRSLQAYILTHEAEATLNLFNMALRYYHNLPPGLCPRAQTSNAKKLYFREFDSGYSVGTAGNKGAGRSQTIQLFHGCLAQGTKIIDPDFGGIRNIESFAKGDSVLTHTGKIAKISFISEQEKECLRMTFRSLSKFPLIATPEHRFWTKEGWKELRFLACGDSIGYPIKKLLEETNKLHLPPAPIRKHGGGRQGKYPNKITLSYRFGRIIGLYIAEGHLKLSNTLKLPCAISFCVHRKEVTRTVEWLASFARYYTKITIKHKNNSLSSIVTIYSNRFSALINNLCGRTMDKHFPYRWEAMPLEFIRGILHGYISGDGSSYAEDRRVRATSIIDSIALSARDIAASLGYGWASIEHKEAGVRSGRNEKEAFTFSLCGEGASRLANEIGKPTPLIKNKKTLSEKQYAANSIEISNGYAWLRVRSIESIGIKKVFDFEIDHVDHSYCTIHGASHNSEVAHWPHADEHSKGVLEAVPNEPGTEIILESTANGIGNMFHDMWQAAVSGRSEYKAIFIPWYWDTSYVANADGFKCDDEERELLEVHADRGLTVEHLAWRRMKIDRSKDKKSARLRYKQEYPFTAEESFLNPIGEVFMDSDLVYRAMQNDIGHVSGKLIIGVDPAIGNTDRTAIIRRVGRKAYGLETFYNHNTMETAGRIKRIIETEKPHKIFIDCIGIGAGVTDRLLEMGYTNIVTGVNVARSANDEEHFKNLRAELWSEMRDWFAQELEVEIPDSDELHADLCSCGFRYPSGQLLIESKDKIKARGMQSPDCFIAGTLVKTPTGDVPIEKLNVGDEIITPFGNSKIIKTWLSYTDEITKVSFSNNQSLEGKGKHKVFSFKSGECQLDALSLTFYEVESYSKWRMMKWRILSLFFTKVANIEFKHLVDIIKQKIKQKNIGFYTAVFGLIISVIFQKAITFTTKMVTGLITISKILSLFAGKSIGQTTCLNGLMMLNTGQRMQPYSKQSGIKQKAGINLKREKTGTGNMDLMFGRIEKQNPQFVNDVINNIKPISRTENPFAIVQEHVIKKGVMNGKRPKSKIVFGAIKSFLRTSIGMSNVVVHHVELKKGFMTRVYNLTLEKHNAYFANNILVFNCADSLMLTFFDGFYADSHVSRSIFKSVPVPPKDNLFR